MPASSRATGCRVFFKRTGPPLVAVTTHLFSRLDTVKLGIDLVREVLVLRSSWCLMNSIRSPAMAATSIDRHQPGSVGPLLVVEYVLIVNH